MKLDAKLRAIIYNVQPRDDWSQGVMEPSPEGKAGCEYVVGGPDQADKVKYRIRTGPKIGEERFLL